VTGLQIRGRDEAPPTPACHAPRHGVYFQPDGVVRPCCTTGYEYGRIEADGSTRLADVLAGPPAVVHRRALDAGRFDLGCRECEVPVLQGHREASLAVHFDRFASADPAWPQLMDFALSNTCNLQCVMCNGELSSAIRVRREGREPLPRAYGDAFFEELRDYLPHLERAQFKGGEPFLSPETWRVWDLMVELGVDCEVSVTTNGTVWNDRVEDRLRALRMHAIVSIDGMTPATFEAIRVGASFDEVWANVDRFDAVTRATGSKMTLSWCLMPQNHHELARFLLETQRRDVNPNVILVNQPRRHDLTRLPPGELAEVVAALRDQDRTSATALTGPHRHEWRTVLDLLEAQLAEPRSMWDGTDEERQLTRTDVDGVRAELEAWAGQPAMAMLIVDGVVREVESPPWAAVLDTQAWVGAAEGDVFPRLVDRVGAAPELHVEEREDGASDIRVGFSAPGTPGFRVVAYPDYGAGRPHLIVPDPDRPPLR
jgi:MoaA/NifB/PqqE/SkfB family radical SAM enzyme